MQRFFQADLGVEAVQHLWRQTLRVGTGTGVLLHSGLALTNHHVVEPALARALGRTDAGFAAACPADELPLDLPVQQLLGPPVRAPSAQHDVVYVEGANGSLHYPYRTLEARLVFSPARPALLHERPLPGGLPNYALDIVVLRLYYSGTPLTTPGLPLSDQLLQEGDLVFCAGHPEGTRRRLTVAELCYERDVELPALLHAAKQRGVPTQIRLAQACLATLHNGTIERQVKAEADLRRRLAHCKEWGREVEATLDQIETLLERKRALIARPSDPTHLDGEPLLYAEHSTAETRAELDHDLHLARERLAEARRRMGDDWEDADGDLRLMVGHARGVVGRRTHSHALPGRTEADIYLLDVDVTSGCSGGPVVNTQGELVGVIYGGNVASLTGRYERSPEARALAVSVHAVQAALQDKGVKIT